MLSAVSARCCASHSPVMRTYSGELRRPENPRAPPRGTPGGARYGESVSISRRLRGTMRATSLDVSSPRRKTSPLKEIASPRSRAATA